MKLKNGFFTALGTPIDDSGNLVEESLVKHIESQIEAGASGLLLMGSMGIEAYLKNSTFKKAAEVGAHANRGRLPIFVGAMDNSIARVMEKIDMLAGLDIDGVVLTTPFYATLTQGEIVNWFSSIADKSPFPIYLYDLAVITKSKITYPVISELISHENIKGIKTVDWELIQTIKRRHPEADFSCLYSGLDNFDYANMIGITLNLDGMFCCMPKTGRAMYDCIEAKDFTGARVHLDKILYLRDTMISFGLMQSFTYLMNALGFEGNFHQDYTLPITDEEKARLLSLMKEYGEL